MYAAIQWTEKKGPCFIFSDKNANCIRMELKVIGEKSFLIVLAMNLLKDYGYEYIATINNDIIMKQTMGSEDTDWHANLQTRLDRLFLEDQIGRGEILHERY